MNLNHDQEGDIIFYIVLGTFIIPLLIVALTNSIYVLFFWFIVSPITFIIGIRFETQNQTGYVI